MDFVKSGNAKAFTRNFSKYIALRKRINLDPGESKTFRWVRSVGKNAESMDIIRERSEKTINVDFHSHVVENETLFSKAPT